MLNLYCNFRLPIGTTLAPIALFVFFATLLFVLFTLNDDQGEGQFHVHRVEIFFLRGHVLQRFAACVWVSASRYNFLLIFACEVEIHTHAKTGRKNKAYLDLIQIIFAKLLVFESN
ncbi:hypothetical protein [Haliscomenobacter hydrossis]|uniref:hypothetical protein n=1 Tax=Haliscomenobacter hydrossis TaxID=2350 RepID=UPI0005C77AA7|nr:hypothetical protein [Haliscomenobacter hydrossis]